MCSNAPPASRPVFWQGKAQVSALLPLVARFLGAEAAQRLFAGYAARVGVRQVEEIPADARLVQFVETQLAGAIGSASARVMVASVVEEEALDLDDVMRILDEASQLRAYSHALEDKSQSLERATAELRQANEQLKSLDRLKDDFMSSVTHELRTPLTSIRALSELMRDDADMDDRAAAAVSGHHRGRNRAADAAWSTRCWTWPRSKRGTPNGTTTTVDMGSAGAAGRRHLAEPTSESAVWRWRWMCRDGVPPRVGRCRPVDAGGAQPAVQRR